MPEAFVAALQGIARSFERCAVELPAVLEGAATMMTAVLAASGRLFFAGNGGSAADAQHLATEFTVRLTPQRCRRALPAMALTADGVYLTACLNDLGADRIFARQLEAFARPGDLMIGLSTSGRSANLVEAFRYCREAGIGTLLFSAGLGGTLAGLSDLAVLVPEGGPGRVQEQHLALGHLIIERVESRLFDGGGTDGPG